MTAEIPADDLEVSEAPQPLNGTEEKAREQRMWAKLAGAGLSEQDIERVLGRTESA